MKDYRSLERYSIDEWEDDIEWMAGRLDFIWCMRDYAINKYRDLELAEEKDDFYYINNGEVARSASKLYHSVDIKYYNSTIGKQSIEQQYRTYKTLQTMRIDNIIEFLKKNNCNLYEYLKYKDADGGFYEVKMEERYNEQFV